MRAARFGDVIASMKNGIYKPASEYADDGMPCLRMYNIDAGSIVWRDIKRMRISAEEYAEYGLHDGDLLVNRVNSRELVGKSACIPASLESSVFESKNIRVRIDQSKALPKFINYQLFARGTRYFASNAQQVVGMASISQKQLADFPIVLPDLDEQRYIVADIEKQFSRLDEALVGLKRTRTKLDRYHRSVLAAACNGSLVGIDGSRWPRQTLGEIATTIRNGYSGKPDAQEGTRIFRISAVRRLKLDSDDVRYLNGPISQYEENRVRPGDVLFTRYNGTRNWVGVCAVVPSSIPPTIHPDKLIRVRVPDEILAPNMLAVLASSGAGRAHVEARIRTTAGQSGISGSDLKTLPLAIPPRDVQGAILLELARKLSVVDQLNAEVANAVSKIARLRNSILSKAFGRAD
jgi:type I restriction enzyme S subunit